MPDRVARNRQHLTDLFAGPFPGHAIVVDPEPVPPDGLGDYTFSRLPVERWLPRVEQDYHNQHRSLAALDDDSVPYADLRTHTGVFAATFGCRIHGFEGSNPAALPCVATAAEADRLPQPGPYTPPLDRVFGLAERVVERLGPGAPVSGPDIQSPFDIAALVWRKEDMFVALRREPEAVERLVGRCHVLLKEFLLEFRRRFPAWNPIHCPRAWAPASLGCSLSEDEAGALSVPDFGRFCLPSLVDLADTFGGMFLHCCADADHQYAAFRRIPGLRGLNRVFTRDPLHTVREFEGTTLMVAWTGEEDVSRLLDMSRPSSRWLLNLPYQPLDQSRRTIDRLRSRWRGGGDR